MRWTTPLALLVVLVLAGCSMMPGWAGGEGGPARLDTDGNYRMSATIDVGEALVLEMRDPSGPNYELAGASFDPAVVSLDSLVPDPDEEKRVLYLFTARAKGETVIEMRIRPLPDVPLEAFKIIDLTVED
ncbi:MAG: hypothetical protein KKB70_00835 [Proteobacteria bacterium]|nr:hypothetical protein [Pseudomonadota bacterium]